MISRQHTEWQRDAKGPWALGGGAVLAAIGAYIFQIIGGRDLGSEGFAPVAALWTIGFLIHTVLMFPVEQVMARRLTVVGRTDLRSAVPGFALSVLLSSVVVGVVSALLMLDRFYAADPVFVIAMLILTTSRAVMTVGRAALASERRLVAYGASLVAESATLVALGSVAALATRSAGAFGLAVAIAPLTILVFNPFRPSQPGRQRTRSSDTAATESFSLLGMLLLAATFAQLLIAGGPVVVGLIGGSAASVSVFFITFTLLRGPVTASYGLASTFLVSLSADAASGRVGRLRVWARRLAAGGALGAAAAGAAGWLVGPALVEILYGSEFRPPGVVVGLGSAGVGFALSLLASSQILVALGETRLLAAGWGLGLLAATVSLFLLSGDPMLRVAFAFFSGHGAAFLAISGASLIQTQPTPRQANDETAESGSSGAQRR